MRDSGCWPLGSGYCLARRRPNDEARSSNRCDPNMVLVISHSVVIRHFSPEDRFLIPPAFLSLPYKIATLLYCFNARDEVLLLERAQEPNLGFWSPCGGKLHTDAGESPYACACREAREELCLELKA